MAQSWRSRCWKLGLASGTIGGAIASVGNLTLAQIKADGTLGAKSSIVKSSDRINFQIDGGATRDTNLFHSFSQFSVPSNGVAYFDNALNIQNIIGRVTGESVSNIDGLIRANGTANLFLLNPNGIIFGPNASLDIGGSFVATTANAIQFGDQGFFRASARNVPPPLLTVNPSALLFNQMAAQPINAVEHKGSLSVPPDQSLLLVGGDVSLDNGRVNAPGGRVELGGLSGTGTVGLSAASNNLSLSFPDTVARANVSLTNGAEVNVRAGGGGSIAINAQNLDLAGGSSLQAGINSGLGFIGAQAGDIDIDATGIINLANESAIANSVLRGAVGNSGKINVITGSLIIMNGSRLSASTFGQGNAGNVTLTARDAVSLDGVNRDGLGGVLSRVEAGAVGNSGGINLKTGSLSVTNGARLGASTLGQGNAGDVAINARDTVSFNGVSSSGSPSGVFSLVEEKATGSSGDVTLQAGRLILQGGALIDTGTFGTGSAGNLTVKARSVEAIGTNGQSDPFTEDELPTSSGLFTIVHRGATGDGGDLTVETGRLIVRDGARVDTGTFGAGSAGNLTVEARESVEAIGISASGQFPGGLFTVVHPGTTGDGGDLTVETGRLIVRDGAQIQTATFSKGNAGNLTVKARESVELIGANDQVTSDLSTQTEGTGNAGDLTIDTERLTVQDGAEISAATTSGNGGNIKLQVRELLLLRRGSRISTNAGTEQAGGNGGNITIGNPDGPLIALVALENSTITANAFTGLGGTVIINTQGDFRSPDSDITAISKQGPPQFNGRVEINTPDVELQSSLTPPSANFISPEQVVAGSCLARRNGSQGSFTVTGTGGLPRSPYGAIRGQYDVTSVQPIQASNSAARGAEVVESAPWKRGDPIQEAQGMVVTADGRTLVGTTPQLVALAKAQSLVCHSD